jgi:DNA-binding LacI/PurR family transcriptional regulator
MTVSRVINGGSVAEKTRARVEATMSRLKYRPNATAQAIARARRTGGSQASGNPT